MKALSCIFLFLALIMTAAAADITGKWSGNVLVTGDDGQPGTPSPAYMVVKQTGDTLTGTGGPDENQQWPIQNGQIVGNTITAQVTSPEGTVYSLTMTANGDRIAGDVTMTVGSQSRKAKIEFTRVK